MKLLFLERSLARGGSEHQLVALCIGLSERGHEVVVALFYDEGALIDELKRAGIHVRIIGKSGRGDLIGFWRRLRQVVASEQPDLLCTFLPVPNIIGALCKLSQPRLPIVWGMRTSTLDLSQYDWLVRVVSWVEPRFARVADLIIANSNAGRAAAIARGFPSNRLVVVPNGIDTERFKPDPEGRRRLRQAWGHDEKTIVIGLIGRLDPVKDHPSFLRAAALLSQRRADVAFVCVGDEGPVRRESLERLAAELKVAARVQWFPGSNDIPAVVSACDLVASTSLTEGFSNVLAEAMAGGRRCVATNVGDTLIILGSTGIVVPSSDPESFARALGEACDEVRRSGTLSIMARERILEHYSVPQMVLNYERLFLSLLDRQGGQRSQAGCQS